MMSSSFRHSAQLPIDQFNRVEARRALLRDAISVDEGVRAEFVAAADRSGDPSYLPLVLRIDPEGPAVRRLQVALGAFTTAQLVDALAEQWDAMCAERWIADEGLTRSAHCAISTARIALAESEPRTVRVVLTALGVNTGSARGRGVRPEAYEMVKALLDAVDGRLRPAQS
jgi:hypothetical protein